MNIKFRLAVEADCIAMLEIYAKYVKETTVSFEYEVPDYNEFKSRMEDVQKRYPWIVCEIDDEVVAYAYASPFNKRAAYEWSVDYSVYVRDDKHKMGIATALYTCLVDILRLQGFYSAFAGISSSNEKSEKFHKNFGFKLVGTYHNAGYKFNKWHDVKWYEYTIREVNTQPAKTKNIHEINFTDEMCEVFQRVEKLISL